MSDAGPRPRVVALVQARMASTRLPGKVLAQAAGRTLLAHVLERLARARRVDEVAVATSDGSADDPLAAEAARLGAPVVRGSESDVLDRFRLAAHERRADVVVRITADCPLIDPAEVDRVVGAFLAEQPGVDYGTNHPPEGRRVALGQAVEVFSRAALERAAAEARSAHEREHVTPFLYQEPGRFRARVFSPAGPDHSAIRLTVDTPEDLAVVRAVLEAVEGLTDGYAFEAALRVLADRPELAGLNAGVRQKSFREAAATAKPSPGAAPPIVVRADAGATIGAGHAMRCLAIAEAWRRLGGAVTLASAQLPAAIGDRFTAAGATLAPLGAVEPGSAADARATLAVLERETASVLVIDGYAFGSGFLEQVGGGERFTVLVDDSILPAAPVDLLLNPNAGARSELYAESRARVLAGASFALLRGELARAVPPVRDFLARPLSLLLTFGGADPLRLTARAARAVLATPALASAVSLTAVIGPAAPDAPELDALAAAAPAGSVRVLRDVRAMAELLASTDLAVAAAGGTSWELARMGVPMLLTTVADNQVPVSEALVAAGAARSLGPAARLDDAGLAAAIADFVSAGADAHRAMSAAGSALIDGRGAERAAAGILALVRARDTPREHDGARA